MSPLALGAARPPGGSPRGRALSLPPRLLPPEPPPAKRPSLATWELSQSVTWLKPLLSCCSGAPGAVTLIGKCVRAAERGEGGNPVVPGRARRLLLCCYRWPPPLNRSSSRGRPETAWATRRHSRLPPLSPEGGLPPLPRPYEPAGAAKAGRSADKSRVGCTAAEAARKTPMEGRATVFGGPELVVRCWGCSPKQAW